ncbi:methyltransferase domain-containing protein [Croceibacterium sp. LX-88]|uniref:Methyltransferase domain-containing protein n=1 Tax=Croceibacterium selenioxidans TaxID=2838833 RepID=A0ABS5W1I6_9SPHN|nr:class I SAM-dependent methyltransferase [Croceibacterium selenioxidans]MBT2133559.1 methyltransferase domain-containing protein [Croceibacterium selenioxidans]
MPETLRRDGNRTFLDEYAPSAIEHGATIYDVGGGSQPFVSLEAKQRFNLTVVGLDVSSEELAKAPEGIYDRAITADLCKFVGAGDADIVICQATLEHVPDVAGAIRAIASILAPGGKAFLFAPSRNALFARLNLLLPQGLKTKLLFSLFPSTDDGHNGFPAYYDNCTPRDIERLVQDNGLVVKDRALFWMSAYFMAFVPAYLIWRLAQGVSYGIRRGNAAETFIYVLEKPEMNGRS